jgi:hypothetical protein
MENKKTIIVSNLLVIAGMFFIGADWAGERVRRLFHNYFADIAIPFGYYLLLILVEDKFKPLKKWYVKAGVVFGLCAISETLQYFGIYALARVFDPYDYLMYAAGTVLAVFADRVLFKRMFNFWN